MELENYPKNKDIQEQRLAILMLEANKDWGAVKDAKSDLYGMILQRKQWVENQCK